MPPAPRKSTTTRTARAAAAAPAAPAPAPAARRAPRRATAQPVAVAEQPDDGYDDEPEPDDEPVAEFHTEDIATDDRPTYDLVIYGTRGTEYPYLARAPKMTFWFDTGDILQKTQRAEQARAALTGGGLAASTEDQRKWGRALDEEPTASDMRRTMLTFVDACLTQQDSDALTALYRHRDSDVDDLPLIDAALELYHAFEPFFTEEAKKMGMGAPQVERRAPNREQRRAAQRTQHRPRR
jgi:hypothetical protein